MKNIVMIIQDVEKDSPELVAQVVQEALEAQKDACMNIAPKIGPNVITITPKMREDKRRSFDIVRENIAKLYDLTVGTEKASAIIIQGIKRGEIPEETMREIHIALKQDQFLDSWISKSYGIDFYNAVTSIAYLVSEGAYKI